MSKALAGTVLVAGLIGAVVVGVSRPAAVFAQRPGPTARESVADSGLMALPSTSADNAQLVTLVDSRTRAMAVYRIDPSTGKIKLLSVRNINWDLQVLELNSENPLPQEIRSLLDQR